MNPLSLYLLYTYLYWGRDALVQFNLWLQIAINPYIMCVPDFPENGVNAGTALLSA